MYMQYAKKQCGNKALENVCKTPNGYEPRFDKEGIGARKHFPSSPCLAEAWDKLEAVEVIDKNTETDYAGWLKGRKEGCTDNDRGVNDESEGQVLNCAAAAGFCQDQTHGPMARINCPKTCGECTVAPTAARTRTPTRRRESRGHRQQQQLYGRRRVPGQVDMVELDDAVAGKATVREKAWTLTPTTARWTHSPTTDQACFANPESFDCVVWPPSNETAETGAFAGRLRPTPSRSATSSSFVHIRRSACPTKSSIASRSSTCSRDSSSRTSRSRPAEVHATKQAICQQQTALQCGQPT